MFIDTHCHIIPREETSISTPTFKRKSVVAHSVTQILPHHIFYIFQCLRLQWGVEARPLRVARQKNIVIAITSKKGPVQIALFVKPTVVGL